MKSLSLTVIILLSSAFIYANKNHISINTNSDTNNSKILNISLSEAVELSLNNSIDSKRANLALSKTQLQLYTVWSKILVTPTNLSLSGSVSVNDTDNKTGFNYNLGVSHSFTMKTAFEVYKTVLDWKKGLISYHKARDLIKVNTVKTYFKSLLGQKRIEQKNRAMENSKKVFATTADKYNKGLSSEIEKLKAELDYLNKIPEIERIKTIYENDIATLKLLLGIDNNKNLMLTGELPVFEVETVDFKPEMLNDNLNLKMSTLDYQAAINEINSSYSDLTPSLRLQYGLSGGLKNDLFQSDLSDNNAWKKPVNSISISVSIPIGGYLPFSSEQNNILNKTFAVEDLRLSRELLFNKTILDVTNLINSVKNNNKTIKSLNLNLKIANKTFDLLEKEYNDGNIPYDELIKTMNDRDEIEYNILNYSAETLFYLIDIDLILNTDFRIFKGVMNNEK